MLCGGHETENTSISWAVAALPGTGPRTGVHVPAFRRSNTFSWFDGWYGPATTHEPTAPHDTPKRSTSGSVGGVPGNGATMDVQFPPDSVSMKPWLSSDWSVKPPACTHQPLAGQDRSNSVRSTSGSLSAGGSGSTTVVHAPTESSDENGSRAPAPFS